METEIITQSIQEMVSELALKHGSTITPETQTISPTQLYSVLANRFLRIASERNNSGTFTVDETNKKILNMICTYHVGLEGDCKLHKGLMLRGKIGTGKTEIMKCFGFAIGMLRSDFNALLGQKGYLFYPTTKIAAEYQQNGFKGIQAYTRSHTIGNPPRPNHICFDDLGVENNQKYYGNEANVMAEVITHRYELFKTGIHTHFTTNLTLEQITEAYGDRVCDRIVEMCNIIELDGNSRRK